VPSSIFELKPPMNWVPKGTWDCPEYGGYVVINVSVKGVDDGHQKLSIERTMERSVIFAGCAMVR
jgi:hypothetical protein